MNYSVLAQPLRRLRQVREFGLYPNYPDTLARPLVLSLVQMLWDRGESNGYANTIGDDPLPEHARRARY